MRIGIPREIKDGEFRVALTPAAVAQLKEVVVEPGAGAGVGFSDAQYVEAGATLGDAWRCELIVKVKEVLPPEYGKVRPVLDLASKAKLKGISLAAEELKGK